MDNNNNLSINFMGHSADGRLKDTLKHRNYNMDLETFYKSVNQTTNTGCSCCKQDTTDLYCIQPISLPIKPTVLSLCVECLKSLPLGLSVINLSGRGAPPQLTDNIFIQSEV